MMPNTRERVPVHTTAKINRRIRQQSEIDVQKYASNPASIDRRLKQLDEEWDIERAIQANASSLAFAGIVLGGTVDKRWLILPGFVMAFLFQHAVQGWCPPVPILRRLGFRTAYEIEQERQALKVLRGDFAQVMTIKRSKGRNGGARATRQRAKAAVKAARA
jgi:hypothetical protein